MRYIRECLQSVFRFGDREYTLVSFEEDIDFGLFVGVIFADGKKLVTAKCADVDFDKYVIHVQPEQYTDVLSKSYYVGKKVRSQSGKYFGNVVDIGFDDAGGRLMEFVVAKSLLGLVIEKKHIAKQAILKVTKRLIIVQDAVVREPQLREKGRIVRLVTRPISLLSRFKS